METRPGRRPGHRQGLEGRHRGQPRLPQDRAELQSDDGHGRQGRRWPRSRTWSSPATIDPDHIHTPGIFVNRIVQVRDCREAHRAAHRPQARLSRGRTETMAWTRDQMAARAARSCGTASTSTSASASRRWWPTTSPPGIDGHAAERERHARHGPVPLRGRGGRRPDQRRQADDHRAADDQLLLAAPTASR